MNGPRLRGLAVAGSDADGRKSSHNHAQTARNLGRTLRTAAAGARLIQAGGLDSKSPADLATSLADALTELHRLERRLNRRIRRDEVRLDARTTQLVRFCRRYAPDAEVQPRMSCFECLEQHGVEALGP
jgi:hypothetical protein